jgi:hypothetical protein
MENYLHSIFVFTVSYKWRWYFLLGLSIVKPTACSAFLCIQVNALFGLSPSDL